jgi:hypothetical protein
METETNVNKKVKTSVIIYATIIFILSTVFVYLFFGNQNKITTIVESTNTLIKEQTVLIEDLKKDNDVQMDSLIEIKEKHEKTICEKDSISDKQRILFKKREKKYHKKIDSLVRVINTYQPSDLEPVKN